MNLLDYTTSTPTQLEETFKTSLRNGLTEEQTALLRKQYGSNQFQEKETSRLSLLVGQFTNPLMYLLCAAAIISYFLESKTNALLILAIVFINGFLSFLQEYRAHKALQLLKSHISHTATVIRDGIEKEITSSQLVPGDLIKLVPGDIVPADVRLISGSCSVDESIITGESAPVKKVGVALENPAQDPYQATNICFLATTIMGGLAHAVVIGTGSGTYFGSVSRLTVETIHTSGFQERIRRLSTFILTVIGITLLGLLVFHFVIKGSQVDIIQLLLFSIALALGLTPEALPAVTTFALSQGALKLAHHNVIVKRLSAIEDLGAITILCTDKTGTLTENKLSIENILPAPHFTHIPSAVAQQAGERSSTVDTDNKTNLTMLYALLVSRSSPPMDPFDNAIWEYTSPKLKQEAHFFQKIQEIPFDPLLARSAVLAKDKSGDSYFVLRGAVDVVEKLCSLEMSVEQTECIRTEANQGNRILGIAYKKVDAQEVTAGMEQGLTFAGLIAFHDPIKSTTTNAVTKAHKLGITLKMITGDSIQVACAVAQKIGLSKEGSCNAITGVEFAKLSPEKKVEIAHNYEVFARFTPEQKFEIINLLKTPYQNSENKEIHHIVGYLGEGINDAPALKAAHVALAVQGATDNARDAADIILLKKSLLVIIDGIAIGRQVFSNTIKYIVASLSSSSGNFYSIAVASLLIDFLPLLPLQILLVNLLSDFPMIAIATDTVDPEQLQKPHDYSMKEIGFISVTLGLVSSVFDFMFFAYFFHASPLRLQTNWFIESILTELALIFSVRTRLPFFKAQRPSTTLVILTIGTALATIIIPSSLWGQELFHFQQPRIEDLYTIGAIVGGYFITTEIVKLFFVRSIWSPNR